MMVLDEIRAGHHYVNRQGDKVIGLEDLSSLDPLYQQGFRFKDDQDRTYKADGSFNIRPIGSKYDLIRACK